jgi:uncharacterized protein (TIGR02421 family)
MPDGPPAPEVSAPGAVLSPDAAGSPRIAPLDTLPPDLEKLADLDKRLCEVARRIKVLSYLDWPTSLRDTFLAGWRAKDPQLPKPEYKQLDYGEDLKTLRSISADADVGHPVGRYIHQTAECYITAAAMLQGVGSKAFTACSQELYGRPGDPLGSGTLTNMDAADHFIRVTDGFTGEAFEMPPADIPAEQVADTLRGVVALSFGADVKVNVEIDPELPAKAAAGARRVRIQSGGFTAPDVGQLIQHEVLVHSATMRNGKEQRWLRSLGLGAPRTTRTQEGLATLAELVTNTMDIGRMRRIALRIKGIQMGMDGADFLEVFRFFLENGQGEQESYQSSMRIFRGGDPRGRNVFTKDGVYVQGLIYAHLFLLKAIQENKPQFMEHLFCGRLTFGDIVALEPFVESGFISAPRFVPPWVANRRSLAASLSYTIFATRIDLADVQLDDFLEHDR